jgi:hypothetical protein
MGCGSGLPTALGVGFTPLKGEPEVTVKSILGVHYVCVRRTQHWKEVVAEFSELSHAEFYVTALQTKKLQIPRDAETLRGLIG